MHITHNHLVKRQGGNPIAIPTLSGFEAAATTAVFSSVDSDTLLLGASSGAVPAPSVSLNLVPGGTVVTVTSSSPDPTAPLLTPTSAPVSTSPEKAASHSSALSTGTVTGICVGVFAVLALLLLGVYWYLKHSVPKTREIHSRSRSSPHSDARNADGEAGRRRSRLEPWNKLDDDGDHWEGKDKAKGKDAEKSLENEKFNMFEKDPSVRSGKGATSEGHTFDPSTMPNFAQYHPELAEQFARAPERPFLPRLDGPPVVSWDGETVGDDSFLSLRSVRMSTDGMSPTTVMARQTPTATTSVAHRWESAEVLTMDVADASEDDENPFADEVERRQSFGNPFFNAQPAKRNPFSDKNSVKPKPQNASVTTLQRTNSTTSQASTVRANHQAMQSLIAALDYAPILDDDAARRTSMQTTDTTMVTVESEETVRSTPPMPKAM
ncbi:hypothetical protein BV25DRAFT_1213537 [Artomyces pyxidatus]|uniref:Uncharacterized protein n=1 Tax=Artomyces pyxidatus TaxID=48021 RepID=A0ACB8SR36_9AGAM|nr:hypothetical protein BV25DRAFT_1213537 [Artomyces pyxidatus]